MSDKNGHFKSTKRDRVYSYVCIAGEIFGKLTVLHRVGSNKFRQTVWLCQCECGQEIEATTATLRQGRVRSCGCSRWASKGKRGRDRVHYQYLNNAKNRGLPFSLTDEQFDTLTADNCFYCGRPPAQKKRIPAQDHKKNYVQHTEFVYNGIDRIDSSLGYEINNCRTCCRHCNVAKSDYTETEFLQWVKRTFKHLESRGCI